MKSFSIVVDGPDVEQLQQALLPKFRDYSHDVFYYAGNKVVTIAFEKYLFRNSSSLLGVITIDGTAAGKCMVDVIAGGGGEGLFRIDWGGEQSTADSVVRMLDEIGEENGWMVREYRSEAGEQPRPQPRPARRDQHRRHGRRSMRVRYHLRGRDRNV